jgi:acyl carrier protein
MKKDDFMKALQGVLEIEDAELSESTDLKNMEQFEFDSMAIMTLVAFIHETFNKKFSAVQLNKITTVKSLMELIGPENFQG